MGAFVHKHFNLMTKILLAASLAVIVAFCGFSVYIDSLQRGAATKGVVAEITSSGAQSAASIANWLNARIMLTESAAIIAEKAATNTEIL